MCFRTGETPFTYDMLQKYHETAKKNGSMVSHYPACDHIVEASESLRSTCDYCKLVQCLNPQF